MPYGKRENINNVIIIRERQCTPHACAIQIENFNNNFKKKPERKREHINNKKGGILAVMYSLYATKHSEQY